MKTNSPIQVVSRAKSSQTPVQTSSASIGSGPTAPRTSQPISAAQDQLQRSYQQAVEERRRVYAAQHASQDPVKQHMERKGEMLERRIDSLKSQID